MSTVRDISPEAIRALGRIEELASLTDEPGRLTRSLLSKANIKAAATLLDWMAELGMETCHTRDGSVRGVLPGSGEESRPLLVGSHFDTVRNAGKWDGPLGIVSALAAVERLREEGCTLPFPLHLLGFSDEEGTRFHTTYLGSRGMAGAMDDRTLAATDETGTSLGFVLATEGWHNGATAVSYEPGEALGYVELHIEQGRVLEDAGLAAAAVSTIVGQSRFKMNVRGEADHAGTTPMDLRHDALAGAAECVLEIERCARDNPPCILTVGAISVDPGSSNVIAGEVSFTVDFRHPDNSERQRIEEELPRLLGGKMAARGLGFEWSLPFSCDATPCDDVLAGRVLDAVEATTGERFSMPSGAGHDAVAMARVAPVGMVFVRCREGVSHHPREHVDPADVDAGIDILTRILRDWKPDA